MQGEQALVAWLQRRFQPNPARVPVGIGDDMAVVRIGDACVAITTDILLDGVHFELTRHPPAMIGRKALACSLSDCAAMACAPVAATVSLAIPHGTPLDLLKEIYEGMAGLGDAYGCAIVGGDTTSWPGRLAIDVALLAEPMAPRGPVRRDEAKEGDVLCVTGPLGGSIGGHHLSFTPRLDVALAVAAHPALHAMMDLSDGLSLDLHRMCEASACAAVLDEKALQRVISGPARSLALNDGRTALEHALQDGEDFELLLAGTDRLVSAHADLVCVGRCVAMPADSSCRVFLDAGDGQLRPYPPAGYMHGF